MKIQIGILISVSVAVFSSTALSAAFLQGDVFVGGNAGAVGTIYHYNNSGTLLEPLLTASGAEQTGMAFNSDGSILHATNFGPSTITRFSSATGAIIAPNPWLTNDVGSHNESLVFDASGNFYVGQPDGTKDILKRAADGSLLGRFDVATTGSTSRPTRRLCFTQVKGALSAATMLRQACNSPILPPFQVLAMPSRYGYWVMADYLWRTRAISRGWMARVMSSRFMIPRVRISFSP